MAADTVSPTEIVNALLLIKAVLAILAVLLFLYYKFYWERAKRHLPIHFFYTKWRAVRHAIALGIASIGFAVGFTLEIFGESLGFSAGAARAVSSVFEIGSLFAILWVFFQFALEDVPQYAHISEAVHTPHHVEEKQFRLVKVAKEKTIARKKKRGR